MNYISKHINTILSFHNSKETLTINSFYRAIINQSFQRDEYKHILEDTLKFEMMQDLSFDIWQQDRQRIDITKLNIMVKQMAK